MASPSWVEMIGTVIGAAMAAGMASRRGVRRLDESIGKSDDDDTVMGMILTVCRKVDRVASRLDRVETKLDSHDRHAHLRFSRLEAEHELDPIEPPNSL